MNDKWNDDLPLVANTDAILVCHYAFNLRCSFEDKIFNGSVVMLLEPVCQDAYFAKCERLCTLNKNCSEQRVQGFCSVSRDNIFTLEELKCGKFSSASGSTVKVDSHLVFNEKRDINLEKVGIPGHSHETLNSETTNSEFVCVLDCSDIIIIKVAEIIIEPIEYEKEKFKYPKSPSLTKKELNFVVDKWSLKIWKTGVYCQFCFPKVIEIVYRTKPEGSSLLWMKDQDGRPAVYTYGAWINNRSLFPCQEPPIAMATWEATISVEESAIVLMSGDNIPVMSKNNGIVNYYYYTKMKLPLSTLALAVGFWKGYNISENTYLDDTITDLNVIVRIFASVSLLQNAVDEFSKYLVRCIKASESFFGPYPFPRIDILVVPRGFGSLGMASPNIIFLSQSLLAGDGSMCCRVAHEVSHTWFGLMIGAQDWTEEWLSEGFATFMEDILHARTVGMTVSEERDFSEIKDFLRLKTLKSEMENAQQELQILRPNQGEILKEKVDGIEAAILKNGRNPDKAFIQVHYLKGYFLLRHLCKMVGVSEFIQFLKIYVSKYNGQLVDSKEVFELYVHTFPEICKNRVTVDEITSEWLNNSKLPKELGSIELSSANKTYITAIEEAKKWKKLNSLCLKKRNSKRKKFSFDHFSPLSADQLLLVLENLVDEVKLAPTITKHIAQIYRIEETNAELRHRWYELVVKHKYKPGYSGLQYFLQNDLAMGVYLYGELILSGVNSQKALAEDCFYKVKNEMEPNFIVTIQQMLNSASE